MVYRRVSDDIYNRFTRHFVFPCVDLVIFKNQKVLLTKRSLNPYKGFWHLPGTIIRRNEKVFDAVKRAGKSELGINVKIKKFVGYFESVDKFRHDVSLGFIVTTSNNNKIKTDFQSTEIKLHERIPHKTPLHHKQIIIQARKFLK